MIRRALAAAATTTALLSLTLLSACGSGSTSTGATTTGGDGPVRVVASTDVYGSIVSAIGGSDVQVTSIITDPDRDPHSYEADAQNQLALSRAALVVARLLILIAMTLEEFNNLNPVEQDRVIRQMIGLKCPVFLGRVDRSVVFEYNHEYSKNATVEDVQLYAQGRINKSNS